MAVTQCIAMILAGGRAERLGSLTQNLSNAAVSFFAEYRLIDYALHNCLQSGIGTIGILSQYKTKSLQEHISGIEPENSVLAGGVHLLRPAKGGAYTGTADAICQHIGFIERCNPRYVLLLSGTQIYDMDYAKLLAHHVERNADITIAATEVHRTDTHRFGILETDADGRVTGFEVEPQNAKSRLASMGVCIADWRVLKDQLTADKFSPDSRHDLDKDIIPGMLRRGLHLSAYRFSDYWRNVGTIHQLWRANMDMLVNASLLKTPDFGKQRRAEPLADVLRAAGGSRIADGCAIEGEVSGSVISAGARIGIGARVIDSIIMEGAYIGPNAHLYRTIVGPNASIMENASVGNSKLTNFVDPDLCEQGISLVAPGGYVGEGLRFSSGSHITDTRQYDVFNPEMKASPLSS